MKLKLRRVYESGIHTCGLLEYGSHIWTTLEDAHHPQKIKNYTRIPAGTYNIDVRTVSPMAARYRERFGSKHIGMIWLQQVPKFENIYIHVGNVADDTGGCILLGRTMHPQKGFIGESQAAYEEFWPLIMDALDKNTQISIEVSNLC